MIPMKVETSAFLPQIQGEINRMFDHWRGNDSSGATADWVPTVDINEFRDRFVLHIDLPGVDPKAVDITLENGVLTLSGDRVQQRSDDDETMVQRRVERGLGRFYRRFILPDTVDADNVNARDEHGVLTITIPKQARAMPRRIEVAA